MVAGQVECLQGGQFGEGGEVTEVNTGLENTASSAFIKAKVSYVNKYAQQSRSLNKH